MFFHKYNNFYPTKDVLTKYYDGFDRFGIFGFDERTCFIVKYTNRVKFQFALAGRE